MVNLTKTLKEGEPRDAEEDAAGALLARHGEVWLTRDAAGWTLRRRAGDKAGVLARGGSLAGIARGTESAGG